MKKYLLGFLVGVFVTASSTSIMAAVESYTLTKFQTPIYIQNVKYPTDALPVLTLEANGGMNTYVPLRNFSEMIGANVQFDSANNRINITASTTTGTTTGAGTTGSTGNTATINSNNNANPNNNSSNNGKTTGNSNKDKDKDKNKNTTGTTQPSTDGGTTTGTNTGTTTITKEFDDTYKLNVYTVNGVKYVESDEIEEFYFDDDYKATNDEYEFESSGFSTNGTIALENNDTVVLDGIKATKTDDDYFIEYDYFVSTIYPLIK